MSAFKKIVKYVNPYKKQVVLNIISNVFYAIFSTISLISFIPMLDILFKTSERVYEKPVYTGFLDVTSYLQNSLNYFVTQQIEQNENGQIVVLSYICLNIVVLFFLKNLSNYIALGFMTVIRNGVIKDLRNDVYSKILHLPVSYFSEKRKGDLLSRISNDIQEVQWTFLSVIEMFIKQPLIILFTLISMFVISVKLTLFIFIFIPISGLIISYIGKKLRANSDRVQLENGKFLSHVEETIFGLKIIKSFTAESNFENKYRKYTTKLFREMNSLVLKQNLASPLSEFLGVSVIAVILWFGGRMVLLDNSISGSTFIGFMVLAYNILTPAKNITNAMYSVKRGNASASRILNLLETEDNLKDKPDAIEKASFDKEIEFKNVWFKYEDDYVLKDFSLKIPKGKSVALVGQSGSGKSTLVNLITRFYDVDKGEITIDGVNIKDIKKQSLIKLMGMVTQDSILFNDSIFNNIKIGDENASLEAVTYASNVANAHEFIKDLPKQYETNIGDAGNKLSGGQKQRLSIARAVLKNPPIMILDEATSALDAESEKLVQEALEKMTQNRTSIIIAHRLSTIQNADAIIVMRKGKIAEQGKHEELIALKGEYNKLVELQNLN